MNTSQKIQERYDNLFEIIFKELEEEIKNISIQVSSPLVFEIKSINGCAKPNDFNIKLYILRSSALLNLNRIIKELPQEERINFLKIINLKLEDLQGTKVKRFKLEYEQCQESEFTDINIYSDNIINTTDLKEILEKINRFESIWSNTIEEIKEEIEKIIIRIKREEEEQKIVDTGYADKGRPAISWEASDTDLIELITALHEGGFINNKTENLSRKDAFEFFGLVFNQPMKDAESKLSKAMALRKNPTPFLDSLIKVITHYQSEKLKLKSKR